MNPLFQEPLNRKALLALPDSLAERLISVAVHRNHSFELVASVLNPFLALARAKAEFVYGQYDDSVSFRDCQAEADLHLIWLDASRYKLPDFFPWLQSRITALRQSVSGKNLSGCKVLVALTGVSEAAAAMPDTLFLDCDKSIAPLGDAAYDTRLEPFTGTRFSNQACLVLARELGTRAIPDLLFPGLKALVLDLDNTLYKGVLGEDGPEGLEPFIELQETIVGLGRQGFLLALSSRNEEEDARRLFAQRPDFPLKWEDFSAWAINWRPKSEGLLEIAEKLRIGTDAMLFLDDNHGERMQVNRSLPEVRILPADGPEDMLAALRYFPGLRKTDVSVEDTLRKDDVKANQARKRLQQQLRPEDYIRELGIVLDFAVDSVQSSARVNELLHKTNQFVLTLKRPSQEEVAGYYTAPDKCVITVAMKDKLSDSGLIGIALLRSLAGQLVLDELAVSCRALGRGVEDGMIRAMLQLGARTLGTEAGLSVAYRTGPRNRPALHWLSTLSGAALAEAGVLVLDDLPPETLQGVNVSFPAVKR